MAPVTPSRCPSTDVLSAWLDGAVTGDERRIVEAHLPGCAACATAVAELGDVRHVLRSIPEVEPPFGLLPDGHPDEELSAYVDGELATGEIQAVSGHLAGCPQCRRLLQEIDAARTAVRALPRLEPDMVAWPVPAVAGAGGRARRGRRVGVGVALAAGAAALVAGFALVRSPAPGMIDPADLASRHGVRSAVDPGLSLPVFEVPGDPG